MKEHFTSKEPSLAPQSFLKPSSLCILLNVRSGVVMEVKGVKNAILLFRDVWETKQLGLLGKQPEAEQ